MVLSSRWQTFGPSHHGWSRDWKRPVTESLVDVADELEKEKASPAKALCMTRFHKSRTSSAIFSSCPARAGF